MSDNEKRKNKVFLKKNKEKIMHQSDDFYEYDKMKSKIDTVDEEFFEKLESIDYDKIKQDKKSDKSDENTVKQENKIYIDSEEQSQEDIKKPLFDDKIKKDIEETNNVFDFTKPIETVKEENKYLNEDKEEDKEEDDDFGSLDKDIEQNKNDKKDSVFEKFDFIKTENQPLENLDNYNSLFYKDENEDEDEKPLEVTGVINKVNEQRQNIHSLDTIYNDDVDENKDEDEDDDDYGSLDDYSDDDENIDNTSYRASNFVNINQKPNYYKENDFDEDENEDDEEYFVEKKKKKKKKHRCKSFFKYFFLVLFALAAMGVYFGLTHDLFKIDYIKVSGNVINDKKTILEKSGVKVGDNIFLARSGKIKQNLKQIPTIESVNVVKDYPNIISIEIKENYVSSYINTSAGIITIDNFGKVKNTSAENKDLKGIQLKGLKENKFRVGEPFSNDSKKENLILELLTKSYYNTVSLIDFTNEKEIVFKLGDSLKVSFGSLDDYSKKLKILDILIKKIKTDGINASEIILNVGKNPIIVKK